jgi:hypothetical protein
MRRALDVGLGILVGFLIALAVVPTRREPTSSATRRIALPAAESAPAAEKPPETRPPSDTPERSPATSSPDPLREKAERFDAVLKGALGARRTASDMETLLEIMAEGTDGQRCDAIHRLGYVVLQSPRGDATARAALEKAVRTDPYDQARAIALRYFYRMPDDGFEVYVDRLMNADVETRLNAVELVDDMALGQQQYFDRLRAWAFSDPLTREQVLKIAEVRRDRVVQILDQMSGSPGRLGDETRKMLGRLKGRP